MNFFSFSLVFWGAKSYNLFMRKVICHISINKSKMYLLSDFFRSRPSKNFRMAIIYVRLISYIVYSLPLFGELDKFSILIQGKAES